MSTGVTAAVTAVRTLATKLGARPALSAAGTWLKNNALVKFVAGEAATTAAFAGARSAATRSKAAKLVKTQRRPE